MTWTLGIDPGKHGGMALFDGRELMLSYCFEKITEHELGNIFLDISLRPNLTAYLEFVHAMPGQGVTSMFSFGRNYGFLRGLLIAYRIPFHDVSPGAWQARLPIGKSASKSEHKKKLRALAQQHYPNHHVKADNADAILIGEYGVKQIS